MQNCCHVRQFVVSPTGDLGGIAHMREVTSLDNPIDVMYLIHKALRAEALRVQGVAETLEEGGTLQNFKLAFNRWATALVFHAEQEDLFMAASLMLGTSGVAESIGSLRPSARGGSRDRRLGGRGRPSVSSRPWDACRSGSPPGHRSSTRRIASSSSHRTSSRPSGPVSGR